MGCVVTAEQRGSLAGSREPPPPPGRPTAERRLVDPSQRSERGGSTQDAGYWHWDGVRYRWVPLTPRTQPPAFSRR